MLQSVALLTEGYQSEMSIVGRHIHFFAYLDQRLLLQAVGNHIFDADNLQVPFLGKLHQFRHTGHGAILVHDLHQGTGRV